MIEDLTKNIDTAIAIFREISECTNKMESAEPEEKALLAESVRALKSNLKILNNTIPKILSNISVTQKLPVTSVKSTGLEKVVFKRTNSEVEVILSKKDKDKFFEELSISEDILKRLKKGKKEVSSDRVEEFKKTRGYLKISNRFFLNTALKLVKNGYFKDLAGELKRANLEILFQSYIAMILFTTVLSVFASFFLMVFFTFFNVSPMWPIISFNDGSLLLRLIKIIWMPIIIPVATFFVLYSYPSTEKSSVGKRIDQELPFAVIHMSAISGSGIEPTKIFSIIGLGREYPFLRREIRKVLNQINLYGYDLVTALNNAAKSSPSSNLAELFIGLSTTINSGGSLTNFFEKRAETLLMGYRLEREKFTKIAETFMDIYISVVIATPMILLLLLIMISVSGIEIGFSPGQISFLIIALIALINVVFLGVLHIKQPAY